MTWEEFCAAHIPTPAVLAVEAHTGASAYGDVYADAVDVTPCVLETTTRRVRVATQDTAGREVVSSTTAYVPIDTVAPPGSRITLADGTVTRVLATEALRAHGLGLPEHLMLALE